VTWTGAGPLVWTLDGISEPDRAATIRGVILEQPQTRTVPLSELQIYAVEPDAPESVAVPALVGVDGVTDGSPGCLADVRPHVEQLLPISPRREIDELLDDLLFSPGCLAEYGRRYARGVTGPALNDRLRDEIRRSGFVAHGHGGVYASVRVLRRFDVVLRARPTPDEPIEIDALSFARRASGARRKRKREPKRRRRDA
jgi:hypothetical protein